MKTTWIVVGLLVLVLMLAVLRERYENYEEALKAVGQTAGYIVPMCPDGFTMSSDRKSCEKTNPNGTKETASPKCPTGSVFVNEGSQGQCRGAPGSSSTTPPASESSSTTPPASETPTPSPSESSTQPSSVPGSSGVGATSGTATGGTSGVRFGPNSAPTGGRNVWGPVFKGLGEGPGGPVGGDSTKSNAYPALMGGMQGRASTRLEGVGIVPPSGGGLGGDFGFPSSGSLGTDPKSRYLPYSRQPGDQDLIADPYRLASNFSTSSYSVSKTDPVPFLTDFSSFYK